MLIAINDFLGRDLTEVIKAIAATKQAELNAQTEKERLESQGRLKKLELRRDVLIAVERAYEKAKEAGAV